METKTNELGAAKGTKEAEMRPAMSTFRRDAPIKTTGAGSSKYGPCEVCGKNCPEVYMVGGTIRRDGIRVRHEVFGCMGCLEKLASVE